jgi:hypothetical protein
MQNETDTEYKEYYNQMIEAFVNKPEKTSWYQNAFSKFSINGVDSMKWHWSWWAFGGGAGFLLYRKAYVPAFILFMTSFFLSMIPFVSLLIMILSGGLSTFFIYKVFKRRLFEIETQIEDRQTRIATMREIGGYHSWVVWVYGILSTLLLLLNGVMFLAMSQPQ